MLAPAQPPLRYRLFNLRWGAPNGWPFRKFFPREKRASRLGAALSGVFSFQANNTTRAFEYPWAFEALQVKPGLRVLEIGGGLSGLQFALSRRGCEVINVDPGDELFVSAMPPVPETMDRLNHALGTSVTLKKTYLQDQRFPDNSFDRVVAVSVLEHIPDEPLGDLIREISRVLKPGGLFVVTVDLFLNVAPFAAPMTNDYGHNVSMRWLVEHSGLELVAGRKDQLFGFPEFEAQRILSGRDSFLVGQYPAMVQTAVLRKPRGN